jgi:hypothetical protein
LEAIDSGSTPQDAQVPPSRAEALASRGSREEIGLEDILEEVPTMDEGPEIEVLSTSEELDEEDLLEELEIEVMVEDAFGGADPVPAQACDDVGSLPRFYPSPQITVASYPSQPGAELPSFPLADLELSPPPRGAPILGASVRSFPSSPFTDDRFPEDGRAGAGRVTPSFVPVAIDLSRGQRDSTFSRGQRDSTLSPASWKRGPRGRVRVVAIPLAVMAVAGVCAAGFVLRSASAKPVAASSAPDTADKAPTAVAAEAIQPPQARHPPDPPAPPPNQASLTAARADAPGIDVASLPQAPVGTVTVAAAALGHRLFIDGVVCPSSEAVVSCGKHRVKVGSRGRVQVIEVPCGGNVVAEP